MGFNQSEVKDFGRSLLKSGVTSVDALLEHRTEFLNIGKTAIAEALIPFEDESSLFSAKTDWYGYLLDRLNAPFDRFHKNRLTAIAFNYDRSFEWYFFSAMRARFGLNEDHAVDHMKSIPIIHLYGNLGGSPWIKEDRPYVPTLDRQNIYKARETIKIIHGDERNESDFWQAVNALRAAERIVFLGFGYNRKNIERLAPEKWTNCGQSVGTAFGRTTMENDEAGRLIGHGITFGEPSWDILEFLREMTTLDAP